MLILELSDGTTLEVPGARRLRRSGGKLHCENELGETLQLVESALVLHYAIAPDPKPVRRAKKPAKRNVASA